ncbi:MAG TPA: hypothetical protein VIM25_10520 [Candidatus Limnocylindrales bacterium]
MLSAEDLASMTATLTESLPDTCTLATATLASDGAGGQTATPGTPVTVACRVSPFIMTRRSGDAEVVQTGRVVSQAPWTITFPAGTVVGQRAQITHGGQTFEVLEVHSPRSWELAVRVHAELVNAGAG